MMGRVAPKKFDQVNQRWLDPPVVDCSEDLKAGRHAVQSDAAEVDINNIVKRMQKGVALPEFKGEPFYGDVSEFDGLDEMFERVNDANELFMSYPADIRERFKNSPIEMVKFLENPENMKEAVSLGLALKRPDPEPAAPAPAVGSPSGAGGPAKP